MTSAEILARLDAIVDGCESGAMSYMAVREEFRVLNFQLNEKQSIAPAFRPFRKLPSKADTKELETDLCDRQVIDMHWRAFSEQKVFLTPPLSRIFAPHFDIGAAEAYAREKLRAATKAERLGFTELMQCEHIVLRTEAVRKRIRNAEIGETVKGVRTRMGRHDVIMKLQSQPKPLKPEVILGMADAWMAARIVPGTATPIQIARLTAFIRGEPQRDPAAVKRSLASVKKILSK